MNVNYMTHPPNPLKTLGPYFRSIVCLSFIVTSGLSRFVFGYLILSPFKTVEVVVETKAKVTTTVEDQKLKERKESPSYATGNGDILSSKKRK
jgi:hypothetical protein